MDVPVVKTTNCLLAADRAISDLRLNRPVSVAASVQTPAPAQLLPQQLLWFAKSQEFEKAELFNLADCIECGACAYVCPSSIPLVQYYRYAKGEIRHLKADQTKSDNAAPALRPARHVWIKSRRRRKRGARRAPRPLPHNKGESRRVRELNMLITTTSPHVKGNARTASVMRWVILATLPGLIALIWSFGWGSLVQVLLCSTFAPVGEAGVLWLRRRPLGFYLGDYSTVDRGAPGPGAPYAPWWIAAVGTLFCIIFAKQLYGGLGQNPFNPAMVGYALLLVSFPVAMTTNWGMPRAVAGLPARLRHHTPPDFPVSSSADRRLYHGYTLDTYLHDIVTGTFEEVTAKPMFGTGIALGWEWVNAGFLLGGLFLPGNASPWHIPVSLWQH